MCVDTGFTAIPWVSAVLSAITPPDNPILRAGFINGMCVVPGSIVISLYFNACVSSGTACNIGKFSIVAP